MLNTSFNQYNLYRGIPQKQKKQPAFGLKYKQDVKTLANFFYESAKRAEENQGGLPIWLNIIFKGKKELDKQEREVWRCTMQIARTDKEKPQEGRAIAVWIDTVLKSLSKNIQKH